MKLDRLIEEELQGVRGRLKERFGEWEFSVVMAPPEKKDKVIREGMVLFKDPEKRMGHVAMKFEREEISIMDSMQAHGEFVRDRAKKLEEALTKFIEEQGNESS